MSFEPRHLTLEIFSILYGVSISTRQKLIIDKNLYLTKFSKGTKKDNIVVLAPGGATWNNKNHLIHGCDLLGYLNNIDIVYVIGYDQCINFCNVDIVKNISKCVKTVKQLHNKSKIHLVGKSLGGYAVTYYLAHSYNDADAYYIFCSNLVIKDFYEGINEMKWLKNYMNLCLNSYDQKQYNLWKPNKVLKYNEQLNILERLSKMDCNQKVTIIYGDCDKVSKNIEQYCKKLKFKAIKVINGHHCCYHTIEALAFALKCNQL